MGRAAPPFFYAVLAPIVGPLWDGGHLYAAVLAGRAANAVFAGAAVVATGWAARRVLPGRPAVAAVAALVLAGTSMFLLVGGAVYNDLANVLFGALALGVAATALRRGLTTRLVTAAVVVTSLGMLSRLSFVVFVVAVAVAFLFARGASPVRRLLGAAAVVAAPALAAGWFFLRNVRITGNVAGSHPAWAAEHLGRSSRSAAQVVADPDFWTGVFSVFEGHLETNSQWTWWLLLGPLVLAVAACVTAAVRGVLRRGRRTVARHGSQLVARPRADVVADVLVAAMLVAVAALVIVGQVQFTTGGGAPHARYGLPVMPILGIPMAVGLVAGLGRFVAPVLTAAWAAGAAVVWWAVLELSKPASSWPGTLTTTWVAAVAAVVVLVATVIGAAVLELRGDPTARIPTVRTPTARTPSASSRTARRSPAACLARLPRCRSAN
ncbi:hypothetical protein P9139_17465 [Curtobacterium flaccumfaciens]|nr:hypothetical protein P9139_17465 [Curtobacterium flaccumfaciens]